MNSPGALDLEDLPDPSCPRGGALIKVEACAVCGTDVKMLQAGHRDLTYPRILGHEIVGRIAEIDHQGFAEGDLVQVWPGIACGRCRPCLRGNDSLCRSMKILGFNLDGGFAEMMALPEESIDRGLCLLEGHLDPAVLALAEPLACCINGQVLARVSEGDSVLIIGGGPIGCLHALLARLRGAGKVIIAERLENRIATARRLKADRVIDAASESLEEVVAEETLGLGMDVILPATPEVKVDGAMLRMLAPRGRICIFSGPKIENGREMIDLRSMHYRETTLVGAYGSTSSLNREAVRMIASEDLDPGWLITKRSSLDRIGDALAHSAQRLGLKAVIDSF